MKTDIEYAALARGKVYDAGMRRFWRPLEDDGDSRRLEIACLKFAGESKGEAVRMAYMNFAMRRMLNTITAESYRAAVFALAVAIGKVIDGGVV